MDIEFYLFLLPAQPLAYPSSKSHCLPPPDLCGPPCQAAPCLLDAARVSWEKQVHSQRRVLSPGPHPHPPSSLLCSCDVISGQQTPSSVQAPTLHSTHTGCPVCEPPHQLSLCPNALPSPALLANCRVSFWNHPSQPSSSRSSVTCCFVALMGRAQALALASAFLPALLIYRQGLSYSRCVLGVYTEAGQHSRSKRACGVNGYVFG